MIQEKTSTFAEVYERLPSLDFDLLGDASQRRGDLLGDYDEQKLRLSKLFALRKAIKCSDTTRPKLQQEYIKKRDVIKRHKQAVRRKERNKMLKVFNDDKVMNDSQIKREVPTTEELISELYMAQN